MKKTRQNGNALFLILIAVALFATLSYVITQSGRSSGTVDRETAILAAGQVAQYAATLRAAITRMIVTGTRPVDIVFTDPGTGLSTEVFDPAGGGMINQPPPSNIGNAYGGADGTVAGSWGYKDVGSPGLGGFYVYDVGTNDEILGKEAFAYLHDISLAVCTQLNRGLGLPDTPGVQGTISGEMAPIDYASNGGLGQEEWDPAYGFIIEATGSFRGQAFACLQSGAVYDYYHVLIEQ